MMFDRRTHQGLTCMADAIANADRRINGHWLVGIKDPWRRSQASVSRLDARRSDFQFPPALFPLENSLSKRCAVSFYDQVTRR